MIEIVRADSWTGRRRFYLFSHRLYGKQPCWAEPSLWRGAGVLDPAVNPLLRAPHALLMAREDGATVARVLTGVSGGRGYFALFDANDRPAAVRALMEAAFAWQREMGSGEIAGPIAPCPADLGGGVLTEGFDGPPAVQDVYNFPYYDSLLRGCGLEAREEQLAYRVACAAVNRARYARGAAYLRARFGVRVQGDMPLRPREFARALGQVADMPVESARETTAWLMKGLDETLCPVAFAGAEPAALALTLKGGPKRPPRVAMLWTARAWRGRGTTAALFSHLLETCAARGLEEVDASLIDEGNGASRRGVEALGGRIARRYHRYFLKI